MPVLLKQLKIIQTDEGKIDMNDGENPPHFKSHFHELFGKSTKGSQTFRKILKYDAPNNPTYDTNSWCKKPNTSEICPGEIRNAYKATQK